MYMYIYIVAVCSWLLARAVMGVYWVVIDCVMMCFFYDSAKENPLPCTQAIQGRWLTKRFALLVQQYLLYKYKSTYAEV